MLTTRRLSVLAAALATLASGACGGASEAGDESPTITVWTTETEPDRIEAIEAIIHEFTPATGIEVSLVAVAEDQFTQTLTSAAAAGSLPDVMGSMSMASVRSMAASDLVDTEASAAVVESLGEDTFTPAALDLTRDGDAQLSVPSEIWSQLLIYRKDLFQKAGLAPPTTYAEILNAAKTLRDGGHVSFVGPTSPGDVFTQETFEHIALANGCQLIDEAGEVALGSSQCVDAFDFYNHLMSDYSLPGAQDVATVRAAYFSGKAAMIPWSSFILDEMAGLSDDAMPTCPECRDNPAYLAENSGFVTALSGPDSSEPAQFGEVISWVIPAGADTEAAQRFVEHMMSDGYLDSLALAPEGKFPARTGSSPGSTDYVDGWEALPAGVDRKAPLSDFYSDEALDTIRSGPENFARWGIAQGKGDLVGAVQGERPIAAAVAALASGDTDAQGAADEAARKVGSIQESLG